MILLHTEALEFDEVKALVSQSVCSPLGKRCLDALTPTAERTTIERAIQLTSEFRRYLDIGEELPLQRLQDFSSIFEKLEIANLALEPREILQIDTLLAVTSTVRRAFVPRRESLPQLFAFTQQLPDLTALVKQLSHKITETGDLEDSASSRLRSLRTSLRRAREKIEQALKKILQESTSTDLGSEFFTIRNDRFVVSVRLDERKKLKGVVHGSSSSGATLFIEPLAIIEMNNELTTLADQEREEIHRILLELSDAIREHLVELRAAADLLAELDLTAAKARFSKRFNCCAPQFSEDFALRLHQARHVALEKNLSDQGLSIVPITVELDSAHSLLVISGPNTGGKTVALKTVGLFAMMAQSGMHVPAEEATLPVFKQILVDLGDQQSIQANLSTFSAHVANVQNMIDVVQSPALVLIDEIGTGTDPAEGEALAIAIADFFRQSGALTLVTTHHTGLKIYAAQTEGVVNASVEFDEKNLRPTYRLLTGMAGASSGLDIAERLGLQPLIVANARKNLAPDQAALQRFLSQLKTERERWEQLNQELQAEKQAYKERAQQLEQNTKSELEKKIAQLDRNFREAAQKLAAEMKLEMEKAAQKSQREIYAQQIQRQMTRAVEKHREEAARTARIEQEAGETKPTEWKSGDAVEIPGVHQAGVIQRLFGQHSAEILMGSMKMIVPLADCRPARVSAAAISSIQRSPIQVHTERNSAPVPAELNVIGCTVEEAIARAEKFLDESFLSEQYHVRVIHGSGTGKLRKALGEMFSHHPQVERFYAAPQNQGGRGVTIVELKI